MVINYQTLPIVNKKIYEEEINKFQKNTFYFFGLFFQTNYGNQKRKEIQRFDEFIYHFIQTRKSIISKENLTLIYSMLNESENLPKVKSNTGIKVLDEFKELKNESFNRTFEKIQENKFVYETMIKFMNLNYFKRKTIFSETALLYRLLEKQSIDDLFEKNQK
jgi:hypothetical protein